LFEEKSFPRDKVCGECLSALGLSVLRRHNLLAPLEAVGRRIHRSVIVGATSHVSLPLPSPMLGISRAALDVHLLRAARSAGADVCQPVRIERLDPTPAGVALRARDLTSNTVTQEVFDRVFLADGRAALGGDKPAATGTIGIKSHFRGMTAADDAVTLYQIDGGYGGLAPIEGERWNAAFAVPGALLKAHAGDVGAAFAAMRRTNRRLDADLLSAEQCAPWLATPLPRYAVGKRWPANVIPVGNAAAAIEPIGGEGMGLALRSAELAVDALLTGRLHLLRPQYNALWRRRRLACRAGGAALSADFADIGTALLGSTPAAARLAMWAIGK
jgi:flavin-dependent dehydrogenase